METFNMTVLRGSSGLNLNREMWRRCTMPNSADCKARAYYRVEGTVVRRAALLDDSLQHSRTRRASIGFYRQAIRA